VSIGIAGDGRQLQGQGLMQATTQAANKGFLRAAALAVSIAGTLFWIYTFYGIAQVPAGDGSGFQWIAVMPLGLIFLVLTLPALVCAWNGQFLWVALVLGCAGLIAFAYLWNELLGEFYHTTSIDYRIAIGHEMCVSCNDTSRFATA
jgi:hypothetical protein